MPGSGIELLPYGVSPPLDVGESKNGKNHESLEKKRDLHII